MHRYKLLVFLLAINFILSHQVFCQKSTISPYSRYGVGDLSDKGFTRYKSLGGISTGARIPNSINYRNPGSYTSQDSMSFIFDIGIKGSHFNFSTGSNTTSSSTYNLDHLALSFPVTRWWSMSGGLLPYSQVGYSIYDSLQINGQNYRELYEGSGGINRFYIGSAFLLFDKLSLGFNFSYLFGSINYSSKTRFGDDFTYDSEKNLNRSIGDALLEFGGQYFDTINNNWSYNIGVVYTNKTKIKTNNTSSTVMRYLPASLDTIHSEKSEGNIVLPMNLGIGFSMEYKDKLMFGIDYTFKNWENTSSDLTGDLTNSHDINAGLQYIPNRKAIKGYLKKINYRIGGFYTNTYLNINQTPINNYGMTFGLGFPFRRSKSSFNVSCELGERGTINNKLIKESYAIWAVSLTLYDFWFFKSKFD